MKLSTLHWRFLYAAYRHTIGRGTEEPFSPCELGIYDYDLYCDENTWCILNDLVEMKYLDRHAGKYSLTSDGRKATFNRMITGRFNSWLRCWQALLLIITATITAIATTVNMIVNLLK